MGKDSDRNTANIPHYPRKYLDQGNSIDLFELSSAEDEDDCDASVRSTKSQSSVSLCSSFSDFSPLIPSSQNLSKNQRNNPKKGGKKNSSSLLTNEILHSDSDTSSSINTQRREPGKSNKRSQKVKKAKEKSIQLLRRQQEKS